MLKSAYNSDLGFFCTGNPSLDVKLYALSADKYCGKECAHGTFGITSKIIKYNLKTVR